jgi:hypothetical protein
MSLAHVTLYVWICSENHHRGAERAARFGRPRFVELTLPNTSVSRQGCLTLNKLLKGNSSCLAVFLKKRVLGTRDLKACFYSK